MLHKLSIITINKNNATGLKKTCISVITQTYTDFEWIVIDGASDDGSVEIINKYEDKISYWVSEPDMGIYNAMNKGINHATGEYLLFLNSGDYLIHQWTLETIINEINDIKYGDVYYSDVLGDNYFLYKTKKDINIDFFIKNNLNHQNCLIKRSLFDKELYSENYKIISDNLFFIRMLINYNIVFSYLANPISFINGNGFSSNNKSLLRTEKLLILKDLKLTKNNLLLIHNIFIFFKRFFKFIMPYGLYKIIYTNNINEH